MQIENVRTFLGLTDNRMLIKLANHTLIDIFGSGAFNEYWTFQDIVLVFGIILIKCLIYVLKGGIDETRKFKSMLHAYTYGLIR